MNHSLLVQPDGTQSVMRPADGKQFTLEELQAAVGGYIEFVYQDDTGAVVANEEGQLDGLPVNLFATRVFRELFSVPVVELVGPVLFLGAADMEAVKF